MNIHDHYQRLYSQLYRHFRLTHGRQFNGPDHGGLSDQFDEQLYHHLAEISPVDSVTET